MSHGVSGRALPTRIDESLAQEVADALTALASPSRLLILGRLREGDCTVGELAHAAGLSPSATSHQLRLLRHMGWVVRERHGRHIHYALHDPHVADLIAQAVFHVEHLRLGYPAPSFSSGAA
jgi:DNA-binding transcriptional ArsR family regulator